MFLSRGSLLVPNVLFGKHLSIAVLNRTMIVNLFATVSDYKFLIQKLVMCKHIVCTSYYRFHIKDSNVVADRPAFSFLFLHFEFN